MDGAIEDMGGAMGSTEVMDGVEDMDGPVVTGIEQPFFPSLNRCGHSNAAVVI